MSTALCLLALALLGPAKFLLLGTEVAWGAVFDVGRLAPGPAAAVVAAMAGAGLLRAADRLARPAGSSWARPPDPWRVIDLAGVAGTYVAAYAAGLLLDLLVIDLIAPFGEALPRPIAICDAVGASTAAAAYATNAAARRGIATAALLGGATLRGAAVGAAAFAGLGLLLVAATVLAPPLGGIGLPPLGVPDGRARALGALLALEGLLGPLAEEVLFRPFLYVLLLRILPAPAAVGATGILFGLAHGLGPATAPRAAGGIVMTWLYARSGSILPGLIVHAAFNIGLRLLPLSA